MIIYHLIQWFVFFFDLIHFKDLGQKSRNIFVRFLVQMKTSKFAFEIIWPLSRSTYLSGSNGDKTSIVFYFFQEGISALMLGTANNRLNCVKILLQEGADPELKSKVWSYFFFYITVHPRIFIILESIHKWRSTFFGIFTPNLSHIFWSVTSDCTRSFLAFGALFDYVTHYWPPILGWNSPYWSVLKYYLIYEKSIWKNQVRRTRFLVYFELDFYCKNQFQNWFFHAKNPVCRTWFLQINRGIGEGFLYCYKRKIYPFLST